eukprot:gene11927-8512_t
MPVSDTCADRASSRAFASTPTSRSSKPLATSPTNVLPERVGLPAEGARLPGHFGEARQPAVAEAARSTTSAAASTTNPSEQPLTWTHRLVSALHCWFQYSKICHVEAKNRTSCKAATKGGLLVPPWRTNIAREAASMKESHALLIDRFFAAIFYVIATEVDWEAPYR